MDDTNPTRRAFIGATAASAAAAALLGHASLASAGRPGQPARRTRVSVGVHHGAPAIMLGDQPLPAIAYMTYLPHRGRYDDFAGAGYGVYSVACYLGDRGINSTSGIRPFRPGIWVGPGEYDFSAVDADLARVVEARPDALVLLRVNLDVPAWWESLHPGELSVSADGGTLRQSFSSNVWKDQAGQTLLALIRHIAASPYADNLIAYHLGAGQTEEWMYHGNRDRLPDYSEPHQRAFRAWLRRTYTSDATLRAAWNDAAVSLDTAAVPDAAARTGDPARLFRDPDTEQQVIDYYRFHSYAAADAVVHFCRTVKEEVGDSALAGAFYGYVLETTHVDVGQHALYHVLTSPHVEFLASPSSYLRRQAGHDWPYFGLTDSVALHGKLWMNEADTRTHLTEGLSVVAPEINPTGSEPGPYDTSLWLGPDDPRITMSLLRNNLARAITNNAGLWWFDMWGGWYDDPAVMEFMAVARTLVDESLRGDRRSTADVAVFVDEASMAHFGYSRNHNQQFLYGQRLELGAMGTPYDIFQFRDLLDERTHHYSLYVLPNAIKVDRELRRVIRRLRDRGKSFVWGHGAGWFGDGNTPGAAGVTDLTGVEMTTTEQQAHLRVTTVESASAALAGIAPGTTFGTTSAVGAPLVHPTGGNGELLATVEGTPTPGVVRVEHRRGGHSTYSVAPRIPARFLRNAAKEAGAHVYVDNDDVVYANRRFVALHAISDGPRTIHLPTRATTVTDAFGGSHEPIARHTDTVTLQCRQHETYLLRLES
ncbi:beta-galactosidase [Jiangella endophytica]|uniref:beta-galactosidase n=1 Tax=Jiangella endophytica TaxID=1623398 RepID=UPI000E357EFE|nr:beta-galactosidase [Jiangella endophytica]